MNSFLAEAQNATLTLINSTTSSFGYSQCEKSSCSYLSIMTTWPPKGPNPTKFDWPCYMALFPIWTLPMLQILLMLCQTCQSDFTEHILRYHKKERSYPWTPLLFYITWQNENQVHIIILCSSSISWCRGSLFRLLQRNTAKLDWRRRVHMALDVVSILTLQSPVS